MKKITRKYGVALLAIALANFNLSAQDGGGATSELNPLNVIGSKGEAPSLSSGLKSSLPIEDLPQSISVMESDQIKAQGLKSIGDVLDYAPGVINSQGEGHRDAPVIRGVRTTQDLYRNGVRDDVQYYRPLYNVERVEVLRGPNAIVSGFGGAYGIINRVTKKGIIGDDFTELSGSVDSFGETNVQLDKNIQLNDNAAFRVNIFGENLSNHRDFYYGDGFGVNPTLYYDLGNGDSLSISYEYLNQERFIDRGIPTNSTGKPVESYKDIVFGDSSENFSTHEAHIIHAIYEHEISDSLNGRFSAHHNNHDKLYQNLYVPNTFKRKGYGVDANGDDISVEHSGYQEANGTVVLDGYRDTTKRQTSTLSYEISGELEIGGFVNNIIAGFEYLEIENNNDRYHANWLPDNNFDGDTEYFNIMRPMSVNGNIGETNSTRSTNYYDGSNANLADRTFADVKVLSLYLVDELALMDTLDLVLGVRYDNMDFDVDTINTTTYTSSPSSDSDETISPRVGLVFNPLEALSLYTSYSETFSPKAGDQYAKLSSNAEKLDPDTFENIEYGLSYDLPMGLRLSASYFEIEAHKPSWNSTRQASEMEKSEISGYELELIGPLTSQWFLSAAYTNLDAHNDSGVRLKETPENVFSIWNNYLVSDRLAVNLGIIHQDESHITNGSTAKLPEYTRVDAGASYMLTDSTRIGLNIENLTDELYFPHSHGTHQASVGAPINAMLSITSTF